MELFTFLRMGGALQRIRVVELGEGAEVSASLAKFDASKAQCYLTQDRERLLGVIEAGFGDLQPFSRVVRAILTKKMDDSGGGAGKPAAWFARSVSSLRVAPAAKQAASAEKTGEEDSPVEQPAGAAAGGESFMNSSDDVSPAEGVGVAPTSSTA